MSKSNLKDSDRTENFQPMLCDLQKLLREEDGLDSNNFHIRIAGARNAAGGEWIWSAAEGKFVRVESIVGGENPFA